METAFVVFLLLIGAVAVMGKPAFDDGVGSCDIKPIYRYECGFLGIDKATCLRRNCCWDSSDPWAKFCYIKSRTRLPEGLCPVAPPEREECGYYGITKEQCLSRMMENRTCCWDFTVPKTKWCFKQPADNPPLGCYISHGVSGTCKYVCNNDERRAYGMQQCMGRICCYKVPWSSGKMV